jgi:copper(I)-binding protein
MNKTLTKTLSALALAAAALAAAAHGYTAGTLKIGHPWSRATVAGQPGGGFLKIENTGKTPDRLLGGSTPAAERVELHTMAMDGNVMRMREVPAIDLPPGQTVVLEPGRLHLMLMGLKAPLKADTKVPLTLKFEKAGEVQVELKVEAADFGGPAHQH